MSVHPRVCGELALSPPVAQHQNGSSPRVRGTPTRTLPARWRSRFIPACAGNSPARLRWPPMATVHPRVCGELVGEVAHRHPLFGSSPRVRGTLRWPLGFRQPAPVHPRVCGELTELLARAVFFNWFIPACAGNSSAALAKPQAMPVHPRVCGELEVLSMSGRAVDGSSPRVRGTLAGRAALVPGGRFIPACAGNSSATGGCSRPASVHPRVCGELLALAVAHRFNGRFIPACAGNSPARTTPRSRFAVHPRVCGELAFTFFHKRRNNGSSPRVRGTRTESRTLRFTPSGSSPRVRGTR